MNKIWIIVISLLSLAIIALTGYLVWYNPWEFLYALIGLAVIIVLALVAVRLINGVRSRHNSPPAVSGPPAPGSSPSGNKWKGWIKTALTWLLVLGLLVGLGYAAVWLWGVAKPVIKSPAPILSAEKRAQTQRNAPVYRQQRDVIREVVPSAGMTPVCKVNTARILELRQGDWSSWQAVPAGCAAQVDIPPSDNRYRMQCKDLDGNVNGVCDKYTAIRFQKIETPDCLPITVQIWFVHLKA